MSHATVEVNREVPEQARAILAALPGVSVRVTAGPSRLLVGENIYPLAPVAGVRQGHRPDVCFAGGRRGTLRFVVAHRLLEDVRGELEEAGCAYADSTGAAHMAVPGFFLHIHGQRPQSRTLVPAPPGIGVTGVRRDISRQVQTGNGSEGQVFVH